MSHTRASQQRESPAASSPSSTVRLLQSRARARSSNVSRLSPRSGVSHSPVHSGCGGSLLSLSYWFDNWGPPANRSDTMDHPRLLGERQTGSCESTVFGGCCCWRLRCGMGFSFQGGSRDLYGVKWGVECRGRGGVRGIIELSCALCRGKAAFLCSPGSAFNAVYKTVDGFDGMSFGKYSS